MNDSIFPQNRLGLFNIVQVMVIKSEIAFGVAISWPCSRQPEHMPFANSCLVPSMTSDIVWKMSDFLSIRTTV